MMFTMGVYVRFGRRKAFLRRAEWWSSDRDLEERLNHLTRMWIRETGGPPIQDDDHDYSVAREMSARLGGRIASRARPASTRSADAYMSRRQMAFDFS